MTKTAPQRWHDLETTLLEEDNAVQSHDLVVFNDEINTFEHVIETLIEVCEHQPEQAEQCTLIIHYKGKCAVKSGNWDDLVARRNAICHRGIAAEVI